MQRIELTMSRVVATNDSQGSNHEAVDDVGVSCLVSQSFSRSLLVTQREEKDAELSICSFAPYQNEMLMPHCRHDFIESCRSWALFEVMLFELTRLDSRSLIQIHLNHMALDHHGS
jgi:hypothetical protein